MFLGRVLDRGGEDASVPEVRLAFDPRGADLASRAVDDVEGAERAVVETRRRRLHDDGADKGSR